MLPEAESLGVRIALENVWNNFRLSPLEFARYIYWPAVLEALDDVGFNGWATAEIPGGGRERLQEIAERMKRILGLA